MCYDKKKQKATKYVQYIKTNQTCRQNSHKKNHFLTEKRNHEKKNIHTHTKKKKKPPMAHTSKPNARTPPTKTKTDKNFVVNARSGSLRNCHKNTTVITICIANKME